MAKTKLLYILPEYDEATPTHLHYIFKLLEELGKKMDIFLIVEKSKGYPKINNMQKISTPKNIAERFLLIVWARIHGYNKAYVHYSYWGAIFASLFMKTYYWHCEVYDQFSMPFELSKKYFHKKIFDEWPMRLAMKTVSYLVTGTKTVGEYYRKEFNLPGGKIKIVPNWINISRFNISQTKIELRKKYHLPKNKKIVLFAHKSVKRKGADYLPEIISSVCQKIKNVFFVIAGSPGDIIINSGDNCKSVGVIEIPNYMKLADLYIMPSRQEGFPRVLIEAMAAGVPFVAMNVGGTKDVVNNAQAKYLVPAGNIEVFSEKIISLLKNPMELRRLSDIGKKEVQKYDHKKVELQFIKLLST